MEVRAKLTTLRYYAFPERREDAIVEILIRELREAPLPLRPDEELAELTLVMRAQQGDNAAFTQLWGHYGKAAFGFLRIRVSDDKDAEDIPWAARPSLLRPAPWRPRRLWL